MPKVRIPAGNTGRTLVYDLDLEALVRAHAKRVAKASKAAILAGAHGMVGNRPRGFKTGRLLGSIRAGKAKADAAGRAEIWVRVTARDRRAFLVDQLEIQGRRYVSDRGANAKSEAKKWARKVARGTRIGRAIT
jgi:hypothetical protein